MDLVGRDQELQELLVRLRSRRLVTLTGPGGIGKTALARAAAARAAEEFELGYRIVDLTVIDAPDQVSGSLAAQLGFATFEALTASSVEQPVLLLIDNCEHVLNPAADAIAALLQSCEAPTVLATSRSPLGLPDESLVVVGPLPVPDADDAETPALQLLMERAADAGVVLADQQRPAVARLCRELDGVPLALEVAAARLRTMSAEEILGKLHHGADVLSRPGYRGARRHRSVTETVQWSYELLPPAVTRGFERLGVFAGPFTASMAAAITASTDDDPLDVDHLLQAVVDASLVAVEHRGPATWYRLLSTVRTFAQHRLRERGLTETTHDQFTDHVVGRVEELAHASRAGRSTRQHREIITLYDNIAAALRWALAHDDAPDRAFVLASFLWHVVHQAHVDDIAALTEATLARWPDPQLPGAADVAAALATARYLLTDTKGASDLAQLMLPHAARAVHAPVTLPRLLGLIAHARGATDEAIGHLAEAAAAARRRQLPGLAMEPETAQASLLADRGQVQQAISGLGRVGAEARAAGADLDEMWARTTEGYVRLRLEPGSARPIISEALTEAERAGYLPGVVAGLRSLALAQVAGGDVVAAARTLHRLVDEPSLIAAVGAELRMLLDPSAVVLRTLDREAWADVAATARAAPVTSVLLSVGHELFDVQVPSTARVMGIREAVAVVRRELTTVLGDASPSPGSSADTGAPAAFAPRGDIYEVSFAGRTVHLKRSKGVEDLTRLLAEPGRDFHCSELMGAAIEEPSTGELIDDEARRAYEQRIRDLQADIDEAEADHDNGRADHAREELDALVDHLTAALGLGGRRRQAAGSAERARSAVTQRIRSTMRRLLEIHPELGHHLHGSITTGTYCSYRPQPPVVWRRDRD